MFKVLFYIMLYLFSLVLDFVEWGPSPNNLYSKTGCKRLSQKVGLIIQQKKLRN